MRGLNEWTDRRILKIFSPGFQIQSEILMDFRIPPLQQIDVFFGPRFWTLRVIKIFLPGFQRSKMEGQIWLINHNESADLHTPIFTPLYKFYTHESQHWKISSTPLIRHQNLALRACPKFISTPRRYQFNNNNYITVTANFNTNKDNF